MVKKFGLLGMIFAALLLVSGCGQQLKKENEQLKGRLKELENYSDDSLMVIVQEWIESHDNTIDINEFAKNYKIIQSRVEQILNKMVTSGYIEAKS